MVQAALFVGKPGSGKGTQAKLLSAELGWEHFSTGDKFKELRESAGVLGEQVRSVYDAGRLMPDWFATYLFEHTILNLSHERGVVCDGYPRSLSQAEIFDDTMTWLSRPYLVFELAVTDDEAIRRQIERAKVEHRPDSGTEEQLRMRLEQYREHTEPILNFFREKGLVVEIDGEQALEEVQQAVRRSLAA